MLILGTQLLCNTIKNEFSFQRINILKLNTLFFNRLAAIIIANITSMGYPPHEYLFMFLSIIFFWLITFFFLDFEIVFDKVRCGLLLESPYLDFAQISFFSFERLMADWPLDVTIDLNIPSIDFTNSIQVSLNFFLLQLTLNHFPTNPQQLLINIYTHNPINKFPFINRNSFLFLLYLG